VQDGADVAMGEVIARDELAVGGPLLLELCERTGVHHRAAGFELMDMNVDHLRGLPDERVLTGWVATVDALKAASYESILGTKSPAAGRRMEGKNSVFSYRGSRFRGLRAKVRGKVSCACGQVISEEGALARGEQPQPTLSS